jgi:hypothetical protein
VTHRFVYGFFFSAEHMPTQVLRGFLNAWHDFFTSIRWSDLLCQARKQLWIRDSMADCLNNQWANWSALIIPKWLARWRNKRNEQNKGNKRNKRNKRNRRCIWRPASWFQNDPAGWAIQKIWPNYPIGVGIQVFADISGNVICKLAQNLCPPIPRIQKSGLWRR